METSGFRGWPGWAAGQLEPSGKTDLPGCDGRMPDPWWTARRRTHT